MKRGSGSSAIVQRFSYDSSGNVVAVDYSSNNGSTFTTYYYLRNGQGDITKLIDNSGTAVVQYTYDSWGKLIATTGTLASTLGQNQPFRYRAYVYDTETGWYYLQSRYYNPTTCRFISADSVFDNNAGICGYNLYAYCANNPLIYFDSTGESILLICTLIGLGVGIIVGSVGGYHLSKAWNVPKEDRWKYILGGALIGGLIGAAGGYAVGYALSAAGTTGLVFWSGGKSVQAVATEFAIQNGMKVLEQTFTGKLLNMLQAGANALLGKEAAWEFMKPLWQAASEQFAQSASGSVHVFLNSNGISFESTWLQIEYWILREFGIEIIVHFVDVK